MRSSSRNPLTMSPARRLCVPRWRGIVRRSLLLSSPIALPFEPPSSNTQKLYSASKKRGARRCQSFRSQPEGESTDKFFSTKKAVELSSIAFGVAQAETTGSGSTGASAGKAKFEEFTVEKGVDLASVPLYVACCAGAHFPTVMLDR